MAPPLMAEAVTMIDGRVPTEASGNVKLETIREIAETGVTYASAGRITYAAPAIDIGLDWSAAP
jgi:nicotinate-nucleotide pyrophosphorylase (carboxylating)